jgi:tetratricopeptide (TPR) repeat protein
MQRKIKSLGLGTILVFLMLGQAPSFAQQGKASNPKESLIPDIFYDQSWERFKAGSKKEKEEVVQLIKDNVKKTKSEGLGYYYLGIMCDELEEKAQSLKYFNHALEFFPESADIHTRIGELHKQKGKEKDALAQFQKALEINMDIPVALVYVGKNLYDKGLVDEAFSYFLRANELEPKNTEALEYLGKLYVARGLGEEARRVLTQLVKLQPKNSAAHLNLGKAYELLKDSVKSAEHFKKAQGGDARAKEKEKVVEESGYLLARSLYLSGKLAEAEREYKKCIKQLPDKETGYVELGELYERSGRGKEAVKLYLLAFKGNGGLGHLVIRSGEIYENLGEFEEAEKAYKLLSRNGQYKDQAAFSIAQLRAKKKELEQAALLDELGQSNVSDGTVEENYLKMFEQDKGSLVAIEGLKSYYEERGYYDEALKWFRRYDKLQPTSEYNKKLIEAEYKEKLAQDNLRLFGAKSAPKTLTTKLTDDELQNLGFYGDNDRLQELALQMLLKRKDYSSDSSANHRLLNFYLERGKRAEALKRVTRMKSLGILTDSEASSLREKIKQ